MMFISNFPNTKLLFYMGKIPNEQITTGVQGMFIELYKFNGSV